MPTAVDWASLVHYGEGTLRALSEKLPPFVVVTTTSPWRLAAPMLAAEPLAVLQATALERSRLDAIVAAVPAAARIVLGIGSGLATETAKYVAWRSGRALVQVPSIASSNAVFNVWVEVHDGAEHRLETAVPPEAIVVDPALIRQGPPAANRAGVGDIVCIQTAIHDWTMATQRGISPPISEPIAAGMWQILERLEAAADEVGALSDAGIRALFDRYLEQAELKAKYPDLAQHGMSGSDHLFAWNLARVTGRPFLHGEAVALGTVLMAALQGNDPERARRTLDRARVRFRPAALGVTWDEVRETLRTLPAFADAMRPLHALARFTIADEMPTDAASLDQLREVVDET